MKRIVPIPIAAAGLTFAGCGDDAPRTDDTPGATPVPGTAWEDTVLQPGMGPTPGATAPGAGTGTTGAGAGAPR
jgi:hypothetical protein